MTAIRTVVIDDSSICRTRLKEILELEHDIAVVGEASSGDGVLELVAKAKPELLVVDLEMPGTAGQETIARVMANCPLPILVVTGQPEGIRQRAVFESIRRGALELAAKPLHGDHAAEAQLRRTVRRLSAIPVVRHVAGKLAAKTRATRKTLAPSGYRSDASALPKTPAEQLFVGIGASAGGPLALASLLSCLPEDFGAVVCVVQHLPRGFAPSFAEFLQHRVALPVELVHGQSAPCPGRIYLPANDMHLALSRQRNLVLDESPPREGHRPAVDVMMHSLANHAGRFAAGVILSGIGKDGAEGLLALRQKGGRTLAQDEESCAVYGMPRAAQTSGAASHVNNPPELAVDLIQWVRSQKLRAS